MPGVTRLVISSASSISIILAVFRKQLYLCTNESLLSYVIEIHSISLLY